ncbi:MAG: hypothetical protein AUI14_15410 [Actinobacteria bacterium 13_2_20CM_2_71_6]|nr:MAG: hypothetical protein AUI14_15410 [Actinobacteria bacterium 13_2_20CM_2_71_6]
MAAALGDGISFVTAKASEGVTYTDPFYGRTAAKARGVAPLFGAYHVLHPNNISSISGQVTHFLNVINAQSPWWREGAFIIQLDCERWSANDFPQRGDIASWCNQFVDRTGGGWVPIVYASAGQYGNSLGGLGRPLWNANYGNDPAVNYRQAYPGDGSSRWAPYSGRTPDLLQYGSRTIIDGQGNCDANAYRGSLGELIALTSGGRVVDLDYTDPNFGNAKENIYSSYRILLNAVMGLTPEVDNLYWLGQPDVVQNELSVRLDQILEAAQTAQNVVALTPQDRQAIIEGVTAGIGGRLDEINAKLDDVLSRLGGTARPRRRPRSRTVHCGRSRVRAPARTAVRARPGRARAAVRSRRARRSGRRGTADAVPVGCPGRRARRVRRST